MLLVVACAAVAADFVLHDADLDDWREHAFVGHTEYTQDVAGTRRVVRALSRASASGLVRRVAIDLERTPVLHWRWRVDRTFGKIDETTRGGDDYPARVYVVVSDPFFFWRTRAVNYVWASVQPRGSTWDNAYTASSKMVAVRSGAADLGRWVEERRDVRADFRRLFGEDVKRIDAVAIMTDSDDTGSNASAWYGDIWFSAR